MKKLSFGEFLEKAYYVWGENKYDYTESKSKYNNVRS